MTSGCTTYTHLSAAKLSSTFAFLTYGAAGLNTIRDSFCSGCFVRESCYLFPPDLSKPHSANIPSNLSDPFGTGGASSSLLFCRAHAPNIDRAPLFLSHGRLLVVHPLPTFSLVSSLTYLNHYLIHGPVRFFPHPWVLPLIVTPPHIQVAPRFGATALTFFAVPKLQAPWSFHKRFDGF